jgi:hypothetical protein
MRVLTPPRSLKRQSDVLERNAGDFAAQFVLMLQQSILCLEHRPDRSRQASLATRCDELLQKILAWFPLLAT